MRSPGLNDPESTWPSDDARRLRKLPLVRYRPQRSLRRPETTIDRPAVPCIDAHAHLGRWLSDDGEWCVSDVEALIAQMDAAGVRHVVNLDGRWGDELAANLRRYDEAHPGRFSTFAHLDLRVLEESHRSSARKLRQQVHDAAGRGAKGLKVWKDLGLAARDAHGRLLSPDAEVLTPAFDAAGELGLPVTVHIADPIAFFQPLDERNERLEQLLASPEWWFGRPGLPSFDELLAALDRLVGRHADTTFIGAHVGCAAEDLSLVGRMLSAHANYHVDLGARLPELGRQPRAARALILEHPDRVLFGTDEFPVSARGWRRWFRFLESDDEAFAYDDDDPPGSGRWDVSALDLPAPALQALYHDNAARILRLDA